MSKLGEEHWEAMKWILRYLMGLKAWEYCSKKLQMTDIPCKNFSFCHKCAMYVVSKLGEEHLEAVKSLLV